MVHVVVEACGVGGPGWRFLWRGRCDVAWCGLAWCVAGHMLMWRGDLAACSAVGLSWLAGWPAGLPAVGSCCMWRACCVAAPDALSGGVC
jgi:hypothetical protein